MSWFDRDLTPEDLDEDDVRIRPNPKGSRPRTKRRPDFSNAPTGMVLEVHLARYRILTDEGKEITATLAKELRKDGCVICDRVRLDGDISGETGALARIVGVEPRRNTLSRSAEDGDVQEQTIVANADQLVVVMAAANPEPRSRLVDRYLVAAFHAGLKPILVMTKCDLTDPTEFIESFLGFDLEIIKTSEDNPNLEDLRQLLADKTTVFVGHSGVGKTTIINQLVPGAIRATGVVNKVTGRGRHTSSSAHAIRAYGGWIVDTPGIRSFGLSAIDSNGLLRGFEDLNLASQQCPRGCSHLSNSPDCTLDEKAAAGEISPLRLDSFRRLVDSIGQLD